MTTPNAELEAIRTRMRHAAKKSGLTKEQIGAAMGFSPGGARQAVSRLLNGATGHDPRVSTLVAFAKAVGANPKDLVDIMET